jgi:outer membrane protein OmpA-like peptidoglycan-associated protein
MPARAQATVEPRALEQLGPAPGAKPTAKHAPSATQGTARHESGPSEPRTAHAHANGPHQSLPPLRPPAPAVAAARPGQPPVPQAAPPAPVLPPPLIVPTRPPPPPLPPTVSPAAAGDVTKLPEGIRVTFGAGTAALNPETEAALQALAKEAAGAPGTTLSVLAYAADSPDDPSTARRLSLARALAVRSVLITAGLPSMRIYVKALGGAAPGALAGPPDRVDIALATPPPPAAASPPPGAAPPSQKATP